MAAHRSSVREDAYFLDGRAWREHRPAHRAVLPRCAVGACVPTDLCVRDGAAPERNHHVRNCVYRRPAVPEVATILGGWGWTSRDGTVQLRSTAIVRAAHRSPRRTVNSRRQSKPGERRVNRSAWRASRQVPVRSGGRITPCAHAGNSISARACNVRPQAPQFAGSVAKLSTQSPCTGAAGRTPPRRAGVGGAPRRRKVHVSADRQRPPSRSPARPLRARRRAGRLLMRPRRPRARAGLRGAEDAHEPDSSQTCADDTARGRHTPQWSQGCSPANDLGRHRSTRRRTQRR